LPPTEDSPSLWNRSLDRESDRLGRLSEGCAADCVVLDRDPFEGETADLLEIHVEMTVVDGRVVYDRRGMPRREPI